MSDPGPLSWRTDVDIPEIGAVAGDILVLRPQDPERALTIIRRVDRETVMRYYQQICGRVSVFSQALGAPGPPPYPPPSGPRRHLRVLH